MVNERTKIVNLIKDNNIEDALDTIRKSSIESQMEFEAAYCLYRLKRYPDCYNQLSAIGQTDDFRVKELMAQTLYRLERYKESYAIYVDLIKNSADDYEDERETNLAAVVACLLRTDPNALDGVPELGDHMYELIFNKACIEVANENYAGAVQKLTAAEKLCRKTLRQDGAADDEIEEELGIIRTQMGYVQQQQGNIDKALQYYNLALTNKSGDNMLLTELEIAAIDVEALEESNWSLGAKYVKRATKVESSPAIRLTSVAGDQQPDGLKKKKHRKRKLIMPKNFDPNVDPDSERWLPKWQRSNFKKKKDKKDAIGKGTQGAVGGDVIELTAPLKNNTKDSPQPGPRQQRKGKAKKSNKK